jgi:hypothetical protein
MRNPRSTFIKLALLQASLCEAVGPGLFVATRPCHVTRLRYGYKTPELAQSRHQHLC